MDRGAPCPGPGPGGGVGVHAQCRLRRRPVDVLQVPPGGPAHLVRVGGGGAERVEAGHRPRGRTARHGTSLHGRSGLVVPARHQGRLLRHRPRQEHHRPPDARPGGAPARLLPQCRLLRVGRRRLRRCLPARVPRRGGGPAPLRGGDPARPDPPERSRSGVAGGGADRATTSTADPPTTPSPGWADAWPRTCPGWPARTSRHSIGTRSECAANVEQRPSWPRPSSSG